MSVTEAVQDALDKLAAEGSPAQVAARLDMDCCVGVRSSFTTCPVAEWLLVTTGHRVYVGPLWWFDDGTRFGGPLPDVVARFVAGFDAEHYPLLDDAKPA